ncbi:TIGR00730 family Rossman fold protein [Candidatus Saccharibacteria bacterium]|nr:TIGR00730 family Rossman fold protein [Candidatus Saccharibacteria bacterium]
MGLRNIFEKSKKQLPPLQFMAQEEERVRRDLSEKEIKERMRRIEQDFRLAFDALKGHHSTVTFFGSSVIPESSSYYQHARELARKIVEQLNLTIVSGAGPGIMEAANRGAYEADKKNSIGMAIQLPHEQETNRYVSHSASFYYFFSRKMALTFTARAYIFFPGGYGTLDELFEILTLKKNGKIPPIPIILFESDFWMPLHNYLKEVVYEKTHAIDKEDMDIYVITDDQEEVLNIIAGRGL